MSLCRSFVRWVPHTCRRLRYPDPCRIQIFSGLLAPCRGRAVMDGDAVVALGDRTEVLDVVFGTGPPDAVHFVARIADGLRLAYGRRRHAAGAPEQDEVRTALAYLQPRGFLLNARRGNRSEERRVGKECDSTCRSRWSPYHKKKKQQIHK